MASTRLIRTTTPSRSLFHFSPCSRTNTKIRNFASFGDNKERNLYRENNSNQKKQSILVKADMATAERTMITDPKTDGEDLVSMVKKVANIALMWLKILLRKKRALVIHPQMLIEKVILDCRFFALFAVAGSLIGSVLCFLEGTFVVLESYFQYFHTLSDQSSDTGHIVELLIEAIDMFMIGTALLIFGMGLHVMFVGTKHLETKGSQIPASNFFGLFYLKALPKWATMGSVKQAKSKMGHAVMMIMQVGLLEKFKDIPLVTGLDLACFAGAVFVSSASIFLLSQLSIKSAPTKKVQITTA